LVALRSASTSKGHIAWSEEQREKRFWVQSSTFRAENRQENVDNGKMYREKRIQWLFTAVFYDFI